MSSNSSYAYFGIYGEFDPDALARQIGLEPCKSEAQHSRDPVRGIPRCSILRFAQTEADPGDGIVDVYELAEAVCLALKDHAQSIADAVATHDLKATLQVVLWFPVSDDVSTPAIGFSEEVVHFVAATGASIDVDTYRDD